MVRDPNIRRNDPESPLPYLYNSGYPHPRGYAYRNGEEMGQERSFQAYLLIIRERIWWVLAIFLLVLLSTTLVVLDQTPLYKSVGTVEVKREANKVVKFEEVESQELRGMEDFNTEVKILESQSIIEQVAARFKGDDRGRFLKPYLKGKDPSEVSLPLLLYRNRSIIPQRLSRIIAIEYTHPDPEIAANTTNLFMDEYIGFNQRKQLEASLKAVEDLQIRADQQRKKLEDLEFNLQEYREEHETVSFDERSAIENEKLRVLNLKGTESETSLYEVQFQWDLIRTYRGKGKNLMELSFISDGPLVQQLNADFSTRKVEVASLSKRYREKHPTMISLLRSLQEVEDELRTAIQAEVDNIYSDLLRAKARYDEAQAAVKKQEDLLMSIDRLSVDYETMQREAEVNTVIYQRLVERMRETNISSSLDNPNVRALDRAVMAEKPYWPNYILFFGAGIFGGVVLSVGVALIIAHLDDRVKSASEIEQVVGLPLLGAISELKNLPSTEKAKVVASGLESDAFDGFLSLYSSLMLKSEGKNAQCLLVTSTIPGEGKSFLSSNLALTFSAHGEDTLLIDCDLRLSNLPHLLGIENAPGVADYCIEKANFDQVVRREEQTGLHLIPTGNRVGNPSQILSSERFGQLLREARERYPRIILDTPPVSAVSDSLIILPLVDGVLYTIKFNAVKRKIIVANVRRLLEADVPILGAVLNNLKLSLSRYYYSYQNYKYRHYHSRQSPTRKLADKPS
ncbi:MAG: polysaccharide biosynthesis tyrosine autokinase [Opitutae bacterium]|nr:polysaccharide biosynthesis tyrosine autokinase [Opitutae bacterium]